ncbi:hypothetical protein PoB_005102800 [Plakobranchus ocellatus]|uniref:Uncharacterized protein n=1 Tax=Plakobranchus ocellatus TaxID=259542 RepID=A0AAV4C0C4_9GAST|nr:hypothetical protein PoB_005102800 [Plakobranchus ocellatus]
MTPRSPTTKHQNEEQNSSKTKTKSSDRSNLITPSHPKSFFLAQRRSKRRQQKRHAGSIHSSTMSQSTAVTILPSSQVIPPATYPEPIQDQYRDVQQQQKQQQPPQQQQQHNVGVRPDSRLKQCTSLLSTGSSEGQLPLEYETSPKPPE